MTSLTTFGLHLTRADLEASKVNIAKREATNAKRRTKRAMAKRGQNNNVGTVAKQEAARIKREKAAAKREAAKQSKVDAAKVPDESPELSDLQTATDKRTLKTSNAGAKAAAKTGALFAHYSHHALLWQIEARRINPKFTPDPEAIRKHLIAAGNIDPKLPASLSADEKTEARRLAANVKGVLTQAAKRGAWLAYASLSTDDDDNGLLPLWFWGRGKFSQPVLLENVSAEDFDAAMAKGSASIHVQRNKGWPTYKNKFGASANNPDASLKEITAKECMEIAENLGLAEKAAKAPKPDDPKPQNKIESAIATIEKQAVKADSESIETMLGIVHSAQPDAVVKAMLETGSLENTLMIFQQWAEQVTIVQVRSYLTQFVALHGALGHALEDAASNQAPEAPKGKGKATLAKPTGAGKLIKAA